MLRRIDSSKFLSRLFDGLSNLLARQRGLPVVLGIGLIVIALIFQMINFIWPAPLFEFVAILLNGIGVIAALVGLLLATPLGR